MIRICVKISLSEITQKEFGELPKNPTYPMASLDEFLALEKRLEADLAMENSIASDLSVDDFIRQASSTLPSPASRKPYTPSSVRSSLSPPFRSPPSSKSQHRPNDQPMLSHSGDVICESCSKDYAAVFCERCNGCLCLACDNLIHPSSNPLMSRHNRIPLTGSDTRPLACPNHPDETVAYFCLDCESECFCSDCALFGVHKGHQVQKLAKSHPIVLKKVDSLIDDLRKKLAILADCYSGVDRVKKELKTKSDDVLSTIKTKFDELRSLIDKKEAELLDQVHEFSSEQMNILDDHSSRVESRMNEIDSSRDLLQAKSDDPSEIVLLNFYAGNKEALADLLGRNDLEEAMAAAEVSCNLNVDSVKEMVEQMKGIHIEIGEMTL
ncbi:hypothetical protein GEMRC1_001901 [Eukaryota sp. GEM-RC1]